MLAKVAPGLRLNKHIEADGPIVFAHACKMGLEGIVSKRLGSRYRPVARLLKFKNPACEAMRREAEQDWGEPAPLGGRNNAILVPVTLRAGGTR